MRDGLPGDEGHHHHDVDAAFAAIVADFGPTPSLPPTGPPGPLTGPLTGPPNPAVPEEEAAQRAWQDEGHFVPPPPPPLPVAEPARMLAWIGLFGTPALALVLLVLGVVLPHWASVAMVAAFVGGFGYLVATMAPRPPDQWSGDDGARL